MPPSLYLFTLFTLILPLALSHTTFYVDETSKTNNPNGSRDHPFTSLDNAALSLKPGTFNIVLLGQSATINSKVTFPSGSFCTIMPQTVPESGYFPLKFGIGASISVLVTNVTFQNIKFIELDSNRDMYTSALSLSDGFLFLNRTLVSDIHYQEPDVEFLPLESPYTFISAGGHLSGRRNGLILSDTILKNLTNVQISTSGGNVVIKNTSFENIQMDYRSFLNFFETNLEMYNTSLRNARFETKEFAEDMGFMNMHESSVNISTFSARNVSIMNGMHLIGNLVREDLANPTMVEITNVLLEDIVEIENEHFIETMFSGLSSLDKGFGLVFDLLGSSEVTVRNLTARNLNFKNGSLLKYDQDPDMYGFFPKFSLQDIKIYNSFNPTFLFLWLDHCQVENVEFIDVESRTFPMFSFDLIGDVSIQNVFAKNISGSFVSIQNVFSQNLKNLTFYNVSTSQGDFLSGPHNLILLTKYSTSFDPRYSANNQSIVLIDLFIDVKRGYEYIGTEDQEQKVSLMRIQADFGIVFIKNSIWRNIKTRGMQSSDMNVLKVDNLTVNGGSAEAAEIFRFESFDFVKIVNSRFEKNENQGGIALVDVPKHARKKGRGFMISFENISVVESNSSLMTNLFEFKSPKRRIQTEFINCLFQNNNICKAFIVILSRNDGIAGNVIKITKSQNVKISLEGNTLMRNYVRGPGGIFSTDNMQENTSFLIANNNLFQENFCKGSGGIFYFMDSWYQVFLNNNTYKNNTSAENGGIGYIERSTVSFLEQNSFYSDNSAQKYGGLWFIRSSNQLQNTQPPISFTNTVFNNSLSGFNGGAFYLFDGNLSIESSSFAKSQAEESGGVFFLEAFSSLFINDSVFQEITASEGSLIFAASLELASIVIQEIDINHVNSSEGEGTLINVNSGFVMVNSSEISEISGHLLFDLKGSSVKFDGARISNIDCSEVKEACVVNGMSVELEWEDTEIRDVLLQGDLIVLDEKSVEKGEVTTVNIIKVE